ncbi:MAG TPA: hypothetical protein VJA94_16015, partial [Candidatus Angelobacter sp.]
GFMVNNSALLLTLTGIKNRKLVGAPNPYWRLLKTSTSKAIGHLFTAYSDWFEYYWKRKSKPVWPTTEN